MEELQQIEDYLHRGIYPEGLSKGEKANFRRKCKNNYKFEDGVLYGVVSESKIKFDMQSKMFCKSICNLFYSSESFYKSICKLC